ncbi:ATP-binding cassette domain-containing protein [Cellulomonas soli]
MMTVSAQDRIEAVAREPFTTTGRARGWSGAWRSVVDIWGHRELLDLLVRRELKSRYKDSALGFLWSMIRPLTMLFVYYVAIGKVLNGERSIPGFAVFVFTGLTAWGLFSEIVAGGTGSIVGNSGLVKKIYLPREVFPLSVVGSALFNFAIQLSILVAATLVLRQPPRPEVFTYFPVATALLLVLGLALALMLAAANVFLRDMQYLVEVVLMVAMWASPIVYSWRAGRRQAPGRHPQGPLPVQPGHPGDPRLPALVLGRGRRQHLPRGPHDPTPDRARHLRRAARHRPARVRPRRGQLRAGAVMTTQDVSVIRVRGASKQFRIRKDKSLKDRVVGLMREKRTSEEFWALRDIDLDIEAGTTVGLVGHNGSGKSTLLKLVGGILQPTTGMVQHRGRIAALLELGAGFHPDLTGRENVYLNASILGLSKQQTDAYFDAIVDFSGIERFIDAQVKFYSSGMYVRLAFAVAVHVDPEILLVDEVLAVGDEPFQRKCMDRIHQFQAEGRTIVLVSHSAEQVGELCHRAVVLDGGRIVFDGAAERGIQVLREGYETARVLAEAAAANATAAITRPADHATVERVEVLGADGSPSTPSPRATRWTS